MSPSPSRSAPAAPSAPAVDYGAKRARCLKSLTLAEQAIGKKEWSIAYQAVIAAANDAFEDPLRTRGREVLAKLDAGVKPLVEEANTLYTAKSFTEAIAIYRKFSAMSHLPSGKVAAEKLAAADKDPEVQAVAKEGRAKDQWALILKSIAALPQIGQTTTAPKSDAAADTFDAARTVKSMRQMFPADQSKVITMVTSFKTSFAGTAAAQEAEKLLQAIQEDKLLAKVYEEAQKPKP